MNDLRTCRFDRYRPTWLAVALLAFAIASCGEVAGPPGEATGLARVSGDGQQATVGSMLPIPISVRVRDARGSGVTGTLVEFVVESGGGSVTIGSTVSDAGGVARTRWTLGTSTSEQQRLVARAVLGGALVTLPFRATATPAAPARLQAIAGDSQRRAISVRLRDTLVARVADRYDNGIPGADVRWSISAGDGTLATIGAVTDATGRSRAIWTLGATSGEQRVEASHAAFTTTFVATADPPPAIFSVSPDTASPGGSLTIRGMNFSDDPADTELLVNGTSARLLSVSNTEIVAAIPCEPSGPASLSIATNGVTTMRSHHLRNASPIRLAVGEVATLSGPAIWCNEIAEQGGRYILTITNPTPASPPVSFRLRGEAGSTTGASRAGNVRAMLASSHGGREAVRARSAMQRGILQRNARLLVQGSARAPILPASKPVASKQLPALNDTLLFRVPDVAGTNLCAIRTEVRARVVHVGMRAIVLEDILAPLATRMDSLYRAMSAEYDTLHYPLLAANFGDPLAYDAETDGDGHVYLLFSPAVNELTTVAGFVTAGDFFPSTICEASNRAEVFFGVVPTDEGSGYASLATRDNWFRTMRSVLVHENKHIASYAERLARNAATFEEPWLEEATAMVAEELYARRFYGYAQRSNTSYQTSLFCEARPTTAACRGLPFVMYDHFTLLSDYLREIETRTFLAPASPSDISFYGSGWAFLRWLLDRSNTEESTFLRALTMETSLSGASNLQARSGMSMAMAVSDWITALVLDDHPGFTSASDAYAMPSWNLRDVFFRMNIDFPNLYPQSFPLTPRRIGFGEFSVSVNGLLAGTGSVFEIGGGSTQPGRPQLVELAGDPAGSLATAGLRARLARVE